MTGRCVRALGAVVWIAAAMGRAWADVGPLYDGVDGATCEQYNLGAHIAWRNRLGDWRDSADQPQGSAAFASATVKPESGTGPVRFDVTQLVRDWIDGRVSNDGLLITGNDAAPGAAAIQFHSRESADVALHPMLAITLAGGTVQRLAPVADTTLDCSTYRSLGGLPTLLAGGGHHVAMRFDVASLRDARIRAARLELSVARSYGTTQLAVFRLDPPASDLGAPPPDGIAQRYRRDRGIERDPDVLMATGFEQRAWRREWSYVDGRSVVESTTSAPRLKFVPLAGAALQVTIPAGQNLGLDMAYRFADKTGVEPEEIYFRYYVRLADDWIGTRDGGKLPGISATYATAGWGGRKADGSTGWSMRGSFFPAPSLGNPHANRTPIGTYAYHADMQEQFGDAWPWSAGALLERNRWYCIEQYAKVNHPGQKDGIYRAWVDGRPVFERADLHLRDVDSIRIQQVWMNVYFGGQDPTPAPLHLFIDNVVIARRYIGPMAP